MSHRIKKILVVVISLVALLLTTLAFYNSLTFRLVSTDPIVDNFPSSASFIKLRFSKNLKSSVVVKGSNGLISSYSVYNSDLVVLINNPLNINDSYQLTISNISSTGGKKLKDIILKFTPKALSENSLSSNQKQALSNAQQQYNSVQNDKLISLLPFSAGNGEFSVSYRLDYSNQTTTPIVVITGPDLKSQSDGLNWIKLVGSDPAKYKIEYLTAVPQ